MTEQILDKNNFSQNVALITGAGGDIGREVSRRLYEAGYQLYLVDVDASALINVSKELPGAITFVTDLSAGEQFEDLLTTIRDDLPAIDVAFVNAGVIKVGDVIDISPRDIDIQLDINLRSTIQLIKACAENMKPHRSGHIVSTVSLGGIVSLKGSATYSASKFGVRGFLTGLKSELAPLGIHVSGIYPSGVDTQMLRYEANNGGSNLNFISKPLKVNEVGEAVIKVLKTKRLEVYLPYSESLSSRLVGAFPWMIHHLYPLMNWIGHRGKNKYLKSIHHS